MNRFLPKWFVAFSYQNQLLSSLNLMITPSQWVLFQNHFISSPNHLICSPNHMVRVKLQLVSFRNRIRTHCFLLKINASLFNSFEPLCKSQWNSFPNQSIFPPVNALPFKIQLARFQFLSTPCQNQMRMYWFPWASIIHLPKSMLSLVRIKDFLPISNDSLPKLIGALLISFEFLSNKYHVASSKIWGSDQLIPPGEQLICWGKPLIAERQQIDGGRKSFDLGRRSFDFEKKWIHFDFELERIDFHIVHWLGGSLRFREDTNDWGKKLISIKQKFIHCHLALKKHQLI